MASARSAHQRSRFVQHPSPRAPRLRAVPRTATLAPPVEHEVPSPSPAHIQVLAIQAFEVIAGTRSLASLAPLITFGVARRLSELRAAQSDRRYVYRDERPRVPRASTVRIDRPAPEVAEAAVVLWVGSTARAVAARLEWTHQQWRATEIGVL